MFENYKQMSAEEQAQVKALHKAIRSDASFGDRYRCLAWGYVRGFAFRRIERDHRKQTMGDGSIVEHNLPDAAALTRLIGKHIPEFLGDFADRYSLKPDARLKVWLADPSGAIPAPAPRPRLPYVAPVKESA